MRLIPLVKNAIEMSDFFYSTQLLRFQKQGEYRTLTGGILSIGIIVAIVVGFANMILDTLNKNTLTTSFKTEKSPNPTLTTLDTSPQKNFMFGVEIWRHNLNAPTRYFDVVAKLYTEEAGWANTTDLPLVQCTRQHWSQYSDVLKNFDKLQMAYWMCPPIGATYDLFGKYSADHYQIVGLQVYPCNNATDPSRPCEPQANIDALFTANSNSFYFTFYFINSVVNPDSTDYIDYYLEDKNYVLFGPQIASETFLYITDFTIDTDNSIWPYESFEKEKGFFAKDLAVNHPLQYGAGGYYVGFYLAKSSDSYFYKRVVQKISEVFSFVGGIIGAGTAVLFFVNYYTDFSLELFIAQSIFKKKKQNPNLEAEYKDEQNYPPEQPQKLTSNIFKFAKFGIYELCNLVGMKRDWQDMHVLKEYQSQVLKQIDIETMVKRLIFLEHAITFLLDDFQLEGLQLKRPVTAEEIRKLRQRCNFVEEVNSEDSSSQNFDHIKQKLEEVDGSGQPSFNSIEISCRQLGIEQTGIEFESPSVLKQTSKRVIRKKQELEINYPAKGKDFIKGVEPKRFSIQSQIEKVEFGQVKPINNKRISRRSSFLKDLEFSKESGNPISQKIWANLHFKREEKKKSLIRNFHPVRSSILEENQ